jgi:hypothetical protein
MREFRKKVLANLCELIKNEARKTILKIKFILTYWSVNSHLHVFQISLKILEFRFWLIKINLIE